MLALAPPSAYANRQSALSPQSGDTAQIAELSWILFAGGALIFALVITLAAVALFGPSPVRNMIGRRALIVIGGIVFPVAALSVLLIYSTLSQSAVTRAGETPSARIEVAGELWWWRVRYLDQDGRPLLETANEIRIPAGRTVEFILVTDNVIHSFWVPNLAGKIDMVPGHVNRLRVRADAPGVYRGQCAEYCGAQHANMAFYVVAHEAAEFDAWLAARLRPAPEPATAFLQRGRQVFLASDCVDCHTVRGTPAGGTSGPELTHVGSRLSLAAGMLPNSVGVFGGWISASQHIKPGNEMPSFDGYSSEDLRALAAYMESLQ